MGVIRSEAKNLAVLRETLRGFAAQSDLSGRNCVSPKILQAWPGV